MIKFHCTYCSAAVRVSDRSAGKKGRCPTCRKVVEIPSDGGDESAALSAATGKQAPAPARPARRSTPSVIDLAREEEIVISSADTRAGDTDVMLAMPDDGEEESQESKQERDARQAERPMARILREVQMRPQQPVRYLGRIILLIVGVLVILAAATGLAFLAAGRR